MLVRCFSPRAGNSSVILAGQRREAVGEFFQVRAGGARHIEVVDRIQIRTRRAASLKEQIIPFSGDGFSPTTAYPRTLKTPPQSIVLLTPALPASDSLPLD